MAKKTTAKKKPAAKKKTAAEKKTAPKGKSGAKPESSASVSKGDAGKKEKTAAPEKLSPKDLLRKKFGQWKPETLFAPAQDQTGKGFDAPPFGKNIIRDILMRKFDFDFADVAGVSPCEELIRRKFRKWKPENLFVPVPDAAYLKGFTAPGFGDEISRNVLMRKFDFDFADVACVPPPSREELIRRKFGAWKAEKLFVPAEDTVYQKGFAAPGFGEGISRNVLMRKFDFDFADESAKAEAERKAAEEAAKAKAEAERKAAEAKAAAEKAEAERKAAEEAAKAKAEAERKAAEEAAKAKAEAERKAAEEAAKAKAEAERKAAEAKAAAEKAEAERKAAEAKAAAEKAEAERKAAEAKASAEKAEAERKAAEEAAKAKAEAERKAAKPEDPLVRMIRYGAAGLALLFILIIAASYSNSSKYYLEPTDIGIQIWKGRFAPLGEELLVTLKGRTPEEPVKDIYTKEEAFGMTHAYFIQEADAMMKDGSYPLEKVKRVLKKAVSFAPTGQARDAAKEKLNGIKIMPFMYKSDMAASSGNLKDALRHLEEAAKMKPDARQAKLLAGKAEAIRKMMETETSGQPGISGEPAGKTESGKSHK
ncbi:MAG: hypothetical protein AB7S75_25240 [Desulfococcaceae bacterium]